MMTTDYFTDYFQQAQKFACMSRKNPSILTALLQLIDEEKHRFCENHDFSEFFQGEYAFFQKNYKKALKHYLQAQSVPYFKLFCYRASAYVSKEAGEGFKATDYAKKALEVYTDDYEVLTLLEELLSLDENRAEAAQIQQKMKILEEQYGSSKLTLHEPKHITRSDSIPCHPFSAVATENDLLNPESMRSLMSKLYPIKQCDLSAVLKGASLKFCLPKEDPLILNQVFPLAPSFVTIEPVSEEPSLEQSIREFGKLQERKIIDYLEGGRSRVKSFEGEFYVLHGWHEPEEKENSWKFGTHFQRSSGGFYLRWYGKGIAINPGRGFLDHFHHRGLHIQDIDCVIVSTDDPATYSEVAYIHELNYLVNKISANPQVIHYYLNPNACHPLAQILKPQFKQERDSIHVLGCFQDSSDVESIALSDKITMHYFFSEHEAIHSKALGLRLELKGMTEEKEPLFLGYVSGLGWSSLLPHYLGKCDLLVAGFGKTHPHDLAKIKYQKQCLGYYGTYSLISSLHPRLLLCSEFTGEDGDIRLDIVKLLRQEYAREFSNAVHLPIILPADLSFSMDLKRWMIPCSASKVLVDPAQISLIKPSKPFAPYQYLSSNCIYS